MLGLCRKREGNGRQQVNSHWLASGAIGRHSYLREPIGDKNRACLIRRKMNEQRQCKEAGQQSGSLRLCSHKGIIRAPTALSGHPSALSQPWCRGFLVLLLLCHPSPHVWASVHDCSPIRLCSLPSTPLTNSPTLYYHIAARLALLRALLVLYWFAQLWVRANRYSRFISVLGANQQEQLAFFHPFLFPIQSLTSASPVTEWFQKVK
jgi:hypothetical protein